MSLVVPGLSFSKQGSYCWENVENQESIQLDRNDARDGVPADTAIVSLLVVSPSDWRMRISLCRDKRC